MGMIQAIQRGAKAVYRSWGLILGLTLLHFALDVFLGIEGVWGLRFQGMGFFSVLQSVASMVIGAAIYAGSLFYLWEVIHIGGADWGRFWVGVKRFSLRLILQGIVIGLLVLCSTIIGLLPLFLAGESTIGLIFSIILICIAVIMIAAFFLFAPTILVVEDTGVMTSIRESLSFAKGHLISTVGLMLSIALLSFAFAVVVGGTVTLVFDRLFPGLISLLMIYLGQVVLMLFNIAFVLSWYGWAAKKETAIL